IPDYRGPGGVWETQKPPTIGDYLENPETRERAWVRRLEDYPTLLAREPNDGHRALVTLERRGILLAIITQNIDGLHQKAGNSPERVIELHGSAHQLRCASCDTVYPATEIHARLQEGERDPRCEICGGILRSGTVLFGEPLPKAALDRAAAVSNACDVLLVVGSSLVVNPAAQLPRFARQRGASVIMLNRTPTSVDSLADVHILGEAGSTLSDLVQRLDAGT
ncbi:MAG: NAD-dependent deacetylase, partial [Chloroflexota bacterium]|nr:NAD-dependent deacetylase [Chloroflexota bacterium]